MKDRSDAVRMVVETPMGPLEATVRGDRLCAVRFGARRQAVGTSAAHAEPGASAIRARLEAYFAGRIDALDGIRVDPEGTPFQRRVWDALRRVPAGETRSYSELAAAIGAPRAVRAVGLANARNPIALVVPCHRIIGKDGSLTGYGGGLWRKRWLLEHERQSRPAVSSGSSP